MKEYKVTVYYWNSYWREKNVVHKFRGSDKDKDRFVRTAEMLTKKYNKDVYRIMGIAVQ